MAETPYTVVLVTASSEEEARKITDTLLKERKAACVNIISPISSFFWWQGKLDSAQEYLLIIKTRGDLLPEVTNLVKSLHSYSVPEVVALPIVGGNPDYLEWIDRETHSQKSV